MPRHAGRGKHFETVDGMLDRQARPGKVGKSFTGINRSCPSTVGGRGGR